MARAHRRSFLKTTLIALGAATVIVVAAHLLVPSAGAYRVVLSGAWLAGIGLLCVAAGGWVALYRDSRQARSLIDPFLVLNRRRTEAALTSKGGDWPLRLRALASRAAGSRALVVAEAVEIRSWQEIEATLDAEGSLGGLPFMPEMRRFCGQRAQVFRRIDKIYDYGRTKKLRRLDDAYLLSGIRCDGGAHGGCQAGCFVMWKGAWLKRVAAGSPAAAGPQGEDPAVVASPPGSAGDSAQTRYKCQFTELAAASTPTNPLDPRLDLRPLWAGNVTLGAFCVALLTRLFNQVQHLRGGIGYPALARGTLEKTPVVTHGLDVGDRVVVCSAEEITATLDRTGRNRGLWFDRDMVKHCGKRHEVFRRVDRIIDDATGLMRVMKTPCIVLRDADYSGEFLRFCAQEEHLYWREAWLKPAAQQAQGDPSDRDIAVRVASTSS